MKPDRTLERTEKPIGLSNYLQGTIDEKREKMRRQFNLGVNQMPHLVNITAAFARQIHAAMKKKPTVAEAIDLINERKAKRISKKQMEVEN
jgi:hypothetical protein